MDCDHHLGEKVRKILDLGAEMQLGDGSVSLKDTGTDCCIFNYNYANDYSVAGSVGGGQLAVIEVANPTMGMAKITRKTGSSDLSALDFRMKVTGSLQYGLPAYTRWNLLAIIAAPSLDLREDGLGTSLYPSEGGIGGSPPFMSICSSALVGNFWCIFLCSGREFLVLFFVLWLGIFGAILVVFCAFFDRLVPCCAKMFFSFGDLRCIKLCPIFWFMVLGFRVVL